MLRMTQRALRTPEDVGDLQVARAAALVLVAALFVRSLARLAAIGPELERDRRVLRRREHGLAARARAARADRDRLAGRRLEAARRRVADLAAFVHVDARADRVGLHVDRDHRRPGIDGRRLDLGRRRARIDLRRLFDCAGVLVTTSGRARRRLVVARRALLRADVPDQTAARDRADQ